MQVITTSEPAKLPEDVRAMIDETQGLAPGVRFFEERFTAGGTARTFGLGVGLAALGILTCLASIYWILRPNPNGRGFDSYELVPLLAGLVFLFGSYLLFASLGGRQAVAKAQQGGRRTRYGLFLAGDHLISRSWFDTTVIPRPLFKGLDGRSVRYERNGEIKSFNLPATLVGTDARALEAAIQEWATAA